MSALLIMLLADVLGSGRSAVARPAPAGANLIIDGDPVNWLGAGRHCSADLDEQRGERD